MMPWTAVVLAPPEREGGSMVSRLPSFLHPVAGRPLIWHSVNSLVVHEEPPEEVVVVADPDLGPEIFQDLPVPVRVEPYDFRAGGDADALVLPDARLVVMHASAGIEADPLRRFLELDEGAWLGGRSDEVVAMLTGREQLRALLSDGEPFAAAEAIVGDRRLEDAPGVFQVRTRSDLAAAHRRIRDSLVKSLMAAGVTFLLPDSVVVDVDVRIGRDSIVYPGVTIEGQSTIGEETVVGPGCRIIDSWVGSGVEMKGWNYIAHTSVRNRAILEPYVRRGFD